MSTEPVRLERRAAQRFSSHIPVSVRLTQTEHEGLGFAQDLSARGIFFYTDFPLAVGDSVELTLVMPSEITLGENMRVRCKGRVNRLSQMTQASKTGVAVHFEGYEYLPDANPVTEVTRGFSRISGLHDQAPDDEPGLSRHTFQSRTGLV